MPKPKRIKLGTKKLTKCSHCGKRRVCTFSKLWDYYEEKIDGFAWFCKETPAA